MDLNYQRALESYTKAMQYKDYGELDLAKSMLQASSKTLKGSDLKEQNLVKIDSTEYIQLLRVIEKEFNLLTKSKKN